MNNLKRTILINFIIALLLIYLVSSLVGDFTFLVINTYNISGYNELFLGITSLIIEFALIILIIVIFVRRLNKKFDQANKEEIEKNNLIYASLAHDLRTPLTSISGYSKALIDEKIDEEDLGKSYEIIEKKAREMEEILDTLSQYSKQSSSAYKPL